MRNLISYGQHYLQDQEYIDWLIKSAEITKKDNILEVGAGDGRITVELAKKAKKVVAYEIDKRTANILADLTKDYRNVEVIFDNFLRCTIPDNITKIVASLPYQITEPFIEKIKKLPIERASLIVGNTYANSVISEIVNGKLQLLTICYFNIIKICDIPKSAFSPPPNTWSSIIILFPKSKEEIISNPPLFIMREIFEQRDKKLRNALRESLIRWYAAKGLVLTKRQSNIILSSYLSEIQSDSVLEQMNNQEIIELYTFLCSIPYEHMEEN